MEVFLIIRDFLSELGGSEITTRVFADEKKAREVFEEKVNELMCDYEGVVDVCDMGENSAEFYNEGCFLEWHDCISLSKETVE